MKNNDNRVRVTKGLQHWLSRQTAEVQQDFLSLVKKRSEEFKNALQADKLGAMIGLNDLIDEVITRSNRENSCKKGCSFCCHINVDVSEPEAALIAYHCRKNSIRVDAAYLQKRVQVRRTEIAFSHFAACPFLKNNECTIYSVRPISCRTHLVTNEPEFCDTVRYEYTDIGVCKVNDPYVEIELSAFMNALKGKNSDRMERMLLKHFK